MMTDSSACVADRPDNFLANLASSRLLRPFVDVSAKLRAAVEKFGWKHEAVGRHVGYEPSYWTRVYSCERGITLDRLGRLPEDVQREFVMAWAEALGIPIDRRANRDRRRAAILALAQAAQALAEEM